jgi:hypothetical protein
VLSRSLLVASIPSKRPKHNGTLVRKYDCSCASEVTYIGFGIVVCIPVALWPIHKPISGDSKRPIPSHRQAVPVQSISLSTHAPSHLSTARPAHCSVPRNNQQRINSFSHLLIEIRTSLDNSTSISISPLTSTAGHQVISLIWK